MDRRRFVKTVGTAATLVAASNVLARPGANSGRRVGAGAGGVVRIESPDGGLTAELFRDATGRLGYRLARRGRPIVSDSSLGLVVNGRDLAEGARFGEAIDTSLEDRTRTTRGARSSTRDRYRRMVVPVAAAAGAPDSRLEVRAYDLGFAWRYALPAPDGAGAEISGESSRFALLPGSVAYLQDNERNYEGVFHERALEDVSGVAGTPFTVKLPDGGGYLAIAEAGLFNFSGMMLSAEGAGSLRTVFMDDKSFQVAPGSDGMVRSPWRVVLAADELDGLAHSGIISLLNDDPDPALFGDAADWIKPGRALWSWWSEGTGTLGLQKRYADAAAELGFEYILVDEGWEFWGGLGLGKWRSLANLCAHAATRNVGVWVWKRWPKLEHEDYRESFLAQVKAAGAVGVKIDFMDSESKRLVDFYEQALISAARHQLMVNFHGANKPTGEAMRYPNEMTREGIRGLEYNRAGVNTLPPEHNVIVPFTRMLGGHVDYTPVTFNPAKMGDTTFAHQLATAAVFISPVTHWADRPENFLQNPDVAPALDVITGIPTVWDQSIALAASELGRTAVFARRSGQTWVVGALNASTPGSIDVPLDFLDAGRYRATIIADADGASPGLTRAERTVVANDGLEAELLAGGGLVAVLKPET